MGCVTLCAVPVYVAIAAGVITLLLMVKVMKLAVKMAFVAAIVVAGAAAYLAYAAA